MGISAGIDVSASLGEVTSRLDKLTDAVRNQVLRTHPAQAQTVLSPIATFTNGSQLTSLAQVPGGMGWQVERVTFGIVPGGVVTTQGTIILYIGNTEVARTTVVPNAIFFRGYQCYVIPGQDLQAVWIGGAGSSLLVDISAAEFPLLGKLSTNA